MLLLTLAGRRDSGLRRRQPRVADGDVEGPRHGQRPSAHQALRRALQRERQCAARPMPRSSRGRRLGTQGVLRGQYSGFQTVIVLYGLPILKEMTAWKPGYPANGREISVGTSPVYVYETLASRLNHQFQECCFLLRATFFLLLCDGRARHLPDWDPPENSWRVVRPRNVAMFRLLDLHRGFFEHPPRVSSFWRRLTSSQSPASVPGTEVQAVAYRQALVMGKGRSAQRSAF